MPHDPMGPREVVSKDKRELASEPDFSAPVRSISEFVMREDFPECVFGEHVNIGGHTGVVVAVVKQSIRVRSPEGSTTSFNSHGLRRIYGPREEPPPRTPVYQGLGVPPAGPGPGMFTEATPAEQKRAPVATPKTPQEVEPDFEQPALPISELVKAPEFPKNALGKHVEVSGYSGVVVQIVNQSLKIRSRAGISRGYNAQLLRNIHGSA